MSSLQSSLEDLYTLYAKDAQTGSKPVCATTISSYPSRLTSSSTKPRNSGIPTLFLTLTNRCSLLLAWRWLAGHDAFYLLVALWDAPTSCACWTPRPRRGRVRCLLPPGRGGEGSMRVGCWLGLSPYASVSSQLVCAFDRVRSKRTTFHVFCCVRYMSARSSTRGFVGRVIDFHAVFRERVGDIRVWVTPSL